MRRKKVLITAAVLFMVCIFISGILLWGPIQTDTGIYIAAEQPFFVFDSGPGEPVLMRSVMGNRNRFEKYATGDRILIFHDGAMMLSYPAQLNVIFCIRLKKGEASDVPTDVLESLEEMGWIRGGTFGQN